MPDGGSSVVVCSWALLLPLAPFTESGFNEDYNLAEANCGPLSLHGTDVFLPWLDVFFLSCSFSTSSASWLPLFFILPHQTCAVISCFASIMQIALASSAA